MPDPKDPGVVEAQQAAFREFDVAVARSEQLHCPRVPDDASFATCAAADVPCVKCAYECVTCKMPLDTEADAVGHAALTLGEHKSFVDRNGRHYECAYVQKLKLVAIEFLERGEVSWDDRVPRHGGDSSM